MSDYFVIPWIVATRLLCLQDLPGKNIGVSCHFLLQGIFPIQGLHLCLHCRWVLYLNFPLLGLVVELTCLDQEDPLEKEMATHASILAWEFPWTEEPGEL